MPALAGVIESGFGPPDVTLRTMMVALARHGPDGSRSSGLGPAEFGVQFHHTLPEDDFDRQPYAAQDGRYLIVADARIDNRDELRDALGIAEQELGNLSDTDLLARCWERWKLGLFDRLLGDVAMAAWDNVDHELTLARSPLSSRPMFFSQAADAIAFASLPFALCAVPAIGSSPDMDELARFLGGGLFQVNTASMFKGVQTVPQGKAAILRGGGFRLQALWSPGETRLRVSVVEAGELIRHELDRAARAQARRRSGRLACMLSSGRDSSAVAASTARAGENDLLALTAAPRSTVDGLQWPWIADESQIAADTATTLGISQLILRSDPSNITDLLDRVSAVHFQPFNNPVNLPWITQLAHAGNQQGATVMLSGAAGNFTISLGGSQFLSDFWREHGLRQWLGRANRSARTTDLSWPGVVALSFGSLVPSGPYHWARKMSGRHMFDPDLPLLRDPIGKQARAHRWGEFGDARPKSCRREFLSGLVQGIEPGDKYSLTCWGVDMRDPTADRRLAETCLSLPAEALVGSDCARPAYRHAFGDRLSPEIIEGRQKGAQAADWYETIQPQIVLEGFRHYSRNPIVSEIFDLNTVESMIERWPRSGSAADAVYDEYCNQLLGGLAVASFIHSHFAG